MSKKGQLWRLYLLGGVLSACGFALIGWLYNLQILKHEDWSRKSADNTRRTFVLMPKRGEIRDVRGHVLATSLPVRTVCADPSVVGTNYLAVATILAPILQTNENILAERLMPRLRQVERMLTNNVDGKETAVRTNYLEPVKYVVLKHKVSMEDWMSVTQAMKRLTPEWAMHMTNRLQTNALSILRNRSIFSVEDQIRVYPNRTLASHVVGSVASMENTTTMGKVMELAGREGIELKFNSVLKGMPGWRQTETDKSRRELVQYREYDVPARPGYNVVLTLDARLQDIVERALLEGLEKHTPQALCSVMVRPKTGQILAMASYPNYDPNRASESPMESHRNRLISWIPEPGSTFKIVVVSGALNEHLVGLEDRYDCENGTFVFAGKRLHDHERYGLLSVQQIIMKSSNIGAAKIGIKMGKEKLYDYIKGFGFGDPTGIPLPGEERGLVHHQKNWNALSISRVPMGHEIANTPLQMAMAMAAIANKGKLMKPILVDHLEDDKGTILERSQPQVVRQVLSPEAASLMVQSLKTVVSKDGTAAKAALENYVVAGKTGTAQKAGAGGYLPGKYISSFIGFFPADDPEVCISVVYDEPRNGHYGGDVAGPVFKRIAEQAANYLNIKPAEAVDALDKPPTNQVPKVGSTKMRLAQR